MVVGEILTGISLVKASVDFIKSNINTANDISAIAKQIDDMFLGETQIQKKRNKVSNNPFSVKSVAEETINSKLAQEQMQEISTLIDLRFGHGTWAGIIAERSRRIQKAKQKEKEQRKQAEEKKEDILNVIMFIGGIVIALFIIVMFIIFIYLAV